MNFLGPIFDFGAKLLGYVQSVFAAKQAPAMQQNTEAQRQQAAHEKNVADVEKELEQ